MPLIKDGAIVDDRWRTIADGEAVPADGPVIVSLGRWQTERPALLRRGAPLGVRLEADEPPELIADDLAEISVVAIAFPTFTDGRGYSHARVLRQRYGFSGEVRAVGNVLRDQFLFLHRCGFDAFETADARAADAWEHALGEIDVVYQAAADGRTAASAVRRRLQGRNRPVDALAGRAM